MFVFGIAVFCKLVSIQFIDGDKYIKLAEERVVKDFVIEPNRGNVYSVHGNLLATSVPKYEIRLDAVTPSASTFEKYLKPLSDSLEQTVKREHPMGCIAERTIGYERTDSKGNVTRPGLDGAYGLQYLRGVAGRRAKQQIGKGQWKPILDYNQVEPKDGYDIYTTIDVNIQDIAHHALLKQLEIYKAEHGCVVVMDVKTGEIRAISNLGVTRRGTYYEKLNYAVGESHEPGSTFKVMAMMAALEDRVIDTSTVVDTKQGKKRFYGRYISDSHRGGYGKISAARALEVSSNIGLASIIDDNYSKDPEIFLNKLSDWKLDKKLGVSIIGEGTPVIPKPGDEIWSRNVK